MAIAVPWVMAESEEDPCCCEEACDCDAWFGSWSSITVSGVSDIIDGISGDVVPMSFSGVNTTFNIGDNFGNWSTPDGGPEGEPTFGTFGSNGECTDDGAGGTVLTLAIFCNSGDGSGVVTNGYFAGQAYAIQVSVCHLELGVPYPALSPFGGTVTFNP